MRMRFAAGKYSSLVQFILDMAMRCGYGTKAAPKTGTLCGVRCTGGSRIAEFYSVHNRNQKRPVCPLSLSLTAFCFLFSSVLFVVLQFVEQGLVH